MNLPQLPPSVWSRLLAAILGLGCLFLGAVWGSAADATFLRAINLNGPAVTIDGRPFEAGAGAKDFKADGQDVRKPKGAARPPTDAARAQMIRSSVWGEQGGSRISGVPPGAYQVFLYVWEDNNNERFDLLVNGRRS